MKRATIAAKALPFPGMGRNKRKAIPLLISLAAPALGACSMSPVETAATTAPTTKEAHKARKRAVDLAKADPREKECLVRAMYFESNRSSEAGLLSVGTVVMNRVEAPRYPETICGVVGAPRQFAAGVLTRQMAARDLPKIEAIAEDILNGRRHDAVGSAKHFHMAGMRFSYPNMHYVTVAGGNAFYVKGERPERRRIEEPSYQLAAVSAPAPIATASSTMPTSFAAAPLAFASEAPAPAVTASASAAVRLVSNAPLPPNRPLDLDLPKKTQRAFVSPPASDVRLAALMPASGRLRGSLQQD
ncbi:MAG TPA: cell wall hydrolase [Bosea sp. (in: a-proteobacteria)]|jgi:spore germination cell wall hydrolase CwlJ-like protein|uniref:cell wall hydrolase n=1 Tax=Bosea sp. (in: a-proteobacteria) TaxID=1871050 RepID=UPI002E0E65EA|nr:cell wall hydrolase [Bosea sp. (in: a-proteobacteria)]